VYLGKKRLKVRLKVIRLKRIKIRILTLKLGLKIVNIEWEVMRIVRITLGKKKIIGIKKTIRMLKRVIIILIVVKKEWKRIISR
jgi:hypothetical protein